MEKQRLSQYALNWWDRYWFSPLSPHWLGIARIVVCSTLLLYTRTRNFGDLGSISSVFRPSIFPQTLLGEPPWHLLGTFQSLFELSLLLAAIGWKSRFWMSSSLLLAYYLWSVQSSMGSLTHVFCAPLPILFVLTLSRCGDAFSLDSWFRRENTTSSGTYRWPLRLSQLILVLNFWVAGISKLKASGLSWIFSENMQVTLVRSVGTRGDESLPFLKSIALVLAGSPVMSQMMAFGAIAVEILIPLALFSANASRILVPAAILMIWGFKAFIGADFLFWIPLFIVWLPFLLKQDQEKF